MRAENGVSFREMETNTCCDRFLPDIRVTRAMDESPLMTSREFLFGVPDNEHRSVKREDLIVGHGKSFSVFGFQFSVFRFQIENLNSKIANLSYFPPKLCTGFD